MLRKLSLLSVRTILNTALTLGLALLALHGTLSLSAERVAILTASYGAGHDKTAEKIEREILASDPESTVARKNCQEFMNMFTRWISDFAFKFGQEKLPKAYTWVFERYLKKGQNIKSIGNLSLGKKLSDKEMIAWLNEVKPTKIVSTWPGSTEAMKRLHDQGLFLDVEFIAVQTDNIYRPTSPEGKLGYFERLAEEAADITYLPTQEVYDAFIAHGVNPAKIRVSGMPIKVDPNAPNTLKELEDRKVAARKAQGLPANQLTFMIEGGGNAIGNYAIMVGSYLKAFEGQPITLITISAKKEDKLELMNTLRDGAGSDKAKFDMLWKKMKPLVSSGQYTKEELESLIRKGVNASGSRLESQGWTELQPWRATADLDSTKPGGQSTAEIAGDSVPMMIMGNLGSGEAIDNIKVFEKTKLAVVAWNELEVGQVARAFLANDLARQAMVNSSVSFRKMSRMGIIIDRILGRDASAARARVEATEREIPTALCMKGLFAL